MKPQKRYAFIVFLICCIVLPAYGSGSILFAGPDKKPKESKDDEKFIFIRDEARRENFTNDQLRNFIKKMDSPALVVRSTGTAGSLSSNSSSDRLCSILEMSLAKRGFDVRDRSLFESALRSKNAAGGNSIGMSYSDIYAATKVDLLMEISNYSLNDYYFVTGYYDKKGKYTEFEPIDEGTKDNPVIVHPRYIFRGMSLTIKVIVLKDNLVGGSYSYTYVPCSEETGGALITKLYPLRYRPRSESRDYEAILDSDRDSRVMEARSQRLDREMEDFIYNVVAPGIWADMKGEQHDYSADNNAYYSNDRAWDNSLSSLLDSYEVSKILYEYTEALFYDDDWRYKNIQDNLSDIVAEVNNNPLLKKPLREEFGKYIHEAIDEIKKKADKLHYGSYSFESLLSYFEIQPLLDRFKEAVSVEKDQTQINALEEKLESYVKMVKKNSAISKPVREEFDDFIDSSISRIKKEEREAREKENKRVLDSLLVLYEMSSRLDRYKEAVISQDKKQIESIKKEFRILLKEVEANPDIPGSVHSLFDDYIDSAEESIHKEIKKAKEEKKKEEKKKAKEDKKTAKEGEVADGVSVMAVDSTIVPSNSFGPLASTIVLMAEAKIQEQIQERISAIKSKKDAEKLQLEYQQLENDFSKWDYLSQKSMSELNSFVSSSSSASGYQCPPTESSHISFYLPMLTDKLKTDSVFYIFLDNKCIGAGTNQNGFYADFEKPDATSPIHQLAIYAVKLSKGGKTDKSSVFVSPISLDIRNEYTFERVMSKNQLILNLK